MTPTLGGRLQTRFVLVSSIGLLWTLAICPFLPRPDGSTVHLAYKVTIQSSIAMTLLGIGWEMMYHGLQQLRWDKDWPSIMALLMGIFEAAPVWWVLHAVGLVPGDGSFSSPILPLYAIHFGSTWIVIWLTTQGPLRVVQPRWRYEGGTFSRRPPDVLIPFIVTNIGMALALVILWFVWH